MNQMALRDSGARLAPLPQTSRHNTTASPLRFVQRCSRNRRLALETQLQDSQPGASRLGQLLDLQV